MTIQLSSVFSFAFGCFVVLLSSEVLAEHRVALLILNNEYKGQQETETTTDVRAVTSGLEKFGFRCTVVENLQNEYSFRDAIEGFASRTPTRSTALLYYHGRMADPASFLGVNSSNKYTLERALESLSGRGGSQRNLVFVDATTAGAFKGELPEGCHLTFGKTSALVSKLTGKGDLLVQLKSAGESRSNLPKDDAVTGLGTKAIGPRDQFVLGGNAGDEWVNRRGIVFCWCPPGRYIAGSPKDEPGRYPDEHQREVVMKDGFWISKYELTVPQNMRSNNGQPPLGSIARHKLDPLTMVNLDDAKSMTSRSFSSEERKAGRLPNDWEYSMPTEEQWEYAARAGTQTTYSFGNNEAQLPAHANFADKAFYDTGDVYSNYAHRTLSDGVVRLAHVGSYAPNAWGLYDMHGNVAEWCLNTAVRGGSWVNVAADCRSAFRHTYSSRNQENFIGYRIVIQRTSKPERK